MQVDQRGAPGPLQLLREEQATHAPRNSGARDKLCAAWVVGSEDHMTRKDYKLIANAICECMEAPDIQRESAYATGAKNALTVLAHKLADDLCSTNSRFDPSRFLAACKVGTI